MKQVAHRENTKNASNRLGRSFFYRDVTHVAKALLGQRLVRVVDGDRLAGLIVEVEAYLGIQDQAAHTYRGRRTERNKSMWSDGGYAYVYFTYGMHHCMNVVAGREGQPVAVLVRAIEPVEGFHQMYQYRGKAKGDTDLCSGPAKLCQAMHINRDLDGIDLIKNDHLFIEKTRARTYRSSHIVARPRIGVDYAGSWVTKPLRFYLKDNPYISRK